MSQTVLIYASRRQRLRLARQGVSILAEYEDYVLARVNNEQKEKLEQTGFEVEAYGVEHPGAVHVAGAPAAKLERPSTFGPGQHYYLVDFVGPVKAEWLREIEANGGQLQDPEPPSGYVVALDDRAYEWLRTGAPYVRSVAHYGQDKRLSPDMLDGIHEDPYVSRGAIREEHSEYYAPPNVERVPSTFTVRFFQPEDLEIALLKIREIGATPSEPSPGAKVITVSFPPGLRDMRSRIEEIARLHGVRSVEPYVLRQLRNDVASALMGAREVQDPSGLGLSGRGEIVGMADSGLDTGDPATIHPDFAGRISAIRSWPVAPDWISVVTNVGEDDGATDARSGHGTHVAGSFVGDGTASLSVQNAAVRGLAFEARLVFQAIEQRLKWTEAYRRDYQRRYGRPPPDYGLAGLPADLKLIFREAYDLGVRIHTNSWGGGPFGAYDDYAEAVDRFMWEHKDFLLLFAAGNDGADYDRDGKVDEGNVTPPGTAKNCVTVGAAESVRAAGGYQSSYGTLWPSNFPVAPLAGDMPSDNRDDIAAFSSRGPTLDGRFKPDVVAPGTNILSTRSSQLAAEGSFGWGAWDNNERYMFDGGTSMATPLTAGACALIRQYLRVIKRRTHPSAALVKATLLHGAQYRPYRFAAQGEGAYDNAQGWGHVDVGASLCPPPPGVVRWYDQHAGLQTGQSWKWTCTVQNAAAPLALTLVWTDYPGSPASYPNLVNDLDLVVTSPSGMTYYGNNLPGLPGGLPDRTNNVERVIIPNPEAGRYRIRVRGTNVPAGPQDFALVYSGGLQ